MRRMATSRRRTVRAKRASRNPRRRVAPTIREPEDVAPARQPSASLPGVGGGLDGSVAAILDICAALSRRDGATPYVVCALGLVGEAAHVLGRLARVEHRRDDLRVAASPEARAVCMARLVLRGFGTSVSGDRLTIGPAVTSAAIIETLQEGVRFAERTQGGAYDSFGEEDRIGLAAGLAFLVSAYANRAVVPADLLPAMARVNERWRWAEAERETSEMKSNPRVCHPTRKAGVFDSLLRHLGLPPASIGALHQSVKIHIPWMLDPE
jgi:hypothetical protein